MPHYCAMSIRATLREDWHVNRGDGRGIFVVTAFRFAQAARGAGAHPRLAALPVGVAYKLIVSWLLGIDLPWSLPAPGPGLQLQHCVGLVVHKDAVIGRHVAFKQGVTIGISGSTTRPDGAPTIGNDVVVGSGAQILGRITIGDNAVIGAGAIVLRPVPRGAVAVGNPARHFFRRAERAHSKVGD